MAKKKAIKTNNKVKKRTFDDGVTVRMFCQGLGDCFLLSIPRKEKRPYWILIDCGLAMSTPGQNETMISVVTRIRDLTEGEIDLLVVTHEHWDHVSGFGQAAELFDKFKFHRQWVAWTEDPNDSVAQELSKKKKKANQALQVARQQLAGMSPNRARLAGLDGVMAFAGFDKGQLAASKTSKRWTIGAAMEAASKYVTNSGGTVETLLPGSVQKLPGADSGLAKEMRAYVLGPPHDAKKVRKINPSTKTPEVYDKKHHLAFSSGTNWAWMQGLAKLSGVGELVETNLDSRYDAAQPFDQELQIPLSEAGGNEFLSEYYFKADPVSKRRRIDSDWLWAGAEQLALHLDSYTNNTSLVLAFELPETKKVLLFVGDAQVGNWLSWHDHTFGKGDAAVSAEDLLSKTVLYKVGHHGSHNSTLKERGLELMTHPDLVALVPVHHEAVTRLRYGEMPLESLMSELNRRCENRVYRIDDLLEKSGKLPGTWPKRLVKPILVKGDVPYLEYVVRDV
jgi:beta-lactamase superfamily II metal-dependent hydrolase